MKRQQDSRTRVKKTPSPGSFRSFLQSRRFRVGALSTAALALFLAALIGLNALMTLLERQNGWRQDYSFNAVTTTREETNAALSQLAHPVHIYVMSGMEDAQLEELLNRYTVLSPKVTWERADLSLNPTLANRFTGSSGAASVSYDSVVVWCEETGHYKVLQTTDFYSLSLNTEEGAYDVAGLTYERALTSAILYAARDTIPRAMILQGQGELDQNASVLLAELLDANNYDVYYFTLNTTDTELTGSDLLVILSPQRDFSDEELGKIMAFVGQGGSILFTCDYTDQVDRMPNYTALLRYYGFTPLRQLVIASEEEPSTYYQGNRMMLIPHMRSTEITAEMAAGGAGTLLMAGARGFAMPETGDSGLTCEAVLTSGDKSYLRNFSLAAPNATLDRDPSDQSGPFALALLGRRITEGGEVSRAFVLGCSTLLTNEEVYTMTDAQEFITTVAGWLLDDNLMSTAIPERVALRPQLSVRSSSLGAVIVTALPLLVLGAALAVLVPRRRR